MKTGINKNPPHIHAADTSSAVIFDILAATVPAGVVALFFFGLRAFLIIIICVFSGVFFEILSNKILKKTDGNAFLPVIISGILFALIMPSSTPFWIVLAVCAGLAVLKHLYKIINYEIVNAVLLFRVLMSLVFGGFITPLLPFGSASLVGKPSYTEMFFGLQNGNMGEICVAVLILGGIYLCVRKVIFPSVPLAFIAAAAIMSVFFGRDPIREILSGGIFFAAVFFINDDSEIYYQKGSMKPALVTNDYSYRGYGAGFTLFKGKTLYYITDEVMYSSSGAKGKPISGFNVDVQSISNDTVCLYVSTRDGSDAYYYRSFDGKKFELLK